LPMRFSLMYKNLVQLVSETFPRRVKETIILTVIARVKSLILWPIHRIKNLAHEVVDYDHGLQPNWIKVMRRNLVYRGFRVAGGLFAIYSAKKWALSRTETLEIVNRVIEEGFSTTLEGIGYIIGTTGI